MGKLAVVDELLAPEAVTRTVTWGVPNDRDVLQKLIIMFRVQVHGQVSFCQKGVALDFGQMTDDQLRALWLYLQSLPSMEQGR